jgi:hypothetical protein
MSQGQDPFGDFVDLDKKIIVELFELGMKFEKFVSLDVPVKTPGVDVKNLIVSQ